MINCIVSGPASLKPLHLDGWKPAQNRNYFRVCYRVYILTVIINPASEFKDFGFYDWNLLPVDL